MQEMSSWIVNLCYWKKRKEAMLVVISSSPLMERWTSISGLSLPLKKRCHFLVGGAFCFLLIGIGSGGEGSVEAYSQKD
jgi:hypothetical protein